MTLSPEILKTVPRKVAPTGIFYATVATGSILVVISCLLIFYCLARQPQSLKTIMVLIGLLDGMNLIVLIVLPLRRLRREARLLKWGVATPARIVSRSIATGRDGNRLTLAYEFADGVGRAITGSRVLWGDIKPNGRTSDAKILDALAAPLVFYDRDDSETHLFHPASFVEISGLRKSWPRVRGGS